MADPGLNDTCVTKAPFTNGARALYNNLLSFFFCTMSRIRCMRFSGRIKSLQKSKNAHYYEAIECDPNYRNATHEH